ncbi:MAG: hypothetical protein IT558_06365 [Alphaproteobacteria bacterium]|nr:hypothetical protein [Alphaproteobacteria bacterium]
MIKKSGLVAFMCMIMAPTAVYAGEPRLLQTYNRWDAYIYFEGDNKVCYMASRPPTPPKADPKKQQPGKKNNDSYIMVTHRPSEHIRNEVSYQAVSAFKAGSDITLEIDGQKFMLFAQGTIAWSPDADTDSKIVKALKEGKKLVVRATSAKGAKINDNISLEGSSAAYQRIGKECG